MDVDNAVLWDYMFINILKLLAERRHLTLCLIFIVIERDVCKCMNCIRAVLL